MSGKAKIAKRSKGSKSQRAGLQFPVGRIARLMKKSRVAPRIGETSSVALAAVLEYLTAEILELSGNAAGDKKMKRISPRHITLSVKNDEELATLFKGTTVAAGGVVPSIHGALLKKK